MSTLDRVFERAFARQSSIPAPQVNFGAAAASLPVGESTAVDATPVDSMLTGGSDWGAPSAPAEPSGSGASAAAASPEPRAAHCDVSPANDAAADAPCVARHKIERFDWPALSQALLASAAEGFNALASQWHTAGRSTTVVVSSCGRGEGCSSLALALAQCWSARGMRTLLIDGDVDRPGLAAALGLKVDCGWERVLTGQAALPSVVVESSADRVALLPLNEPVPRSRLVPGSLAATLQSLRTQFDFVCLDAGPLSDAHDWFVGPPFDRVLWVRDVRRARLPGREMFERRMGELGIEAWDVVENFAGARHV